MRDEILHKMNRSTTPPTCASWHSRSGDRAVDDGGLREQVGERVFFGAIARVIQYRMRYVAISVPVRTSSFSRVRRRTPRAHRLDP